MSLSPKEPRRRGIGITARTALLSWLASTSTLLIFVVVIIPLQKTTFLENLDSKAHSVAVSLRDVAAGAAVNEDYSSVVDHCKEMLAGDNSIAFLVITKNDGFTLVNDRKGWRAENKAGPEWHPDKREPTSSIGFMPYFDQRLYHYAIPFDYSGIQWGWVHVGLTLDGYDRSVAAVYRRTSILAVLCIFLSLIASTIYAKHLVKPILHLRNVVLRVAGGDLTARASDERGDEIGSLTRSVNSMTEALQRRDRILQSVRFAAQQFLFSTDWRQAVGDIIARIGNAAEVSRILILVNEPGPGGARAARLLFEWTTPGVPSNVGTEYESFTWQGEDLERACAAFLQHEIVDLKAFEVHDELRRYFSERKVHSLLCLPVFADNEWWGIICLEDCKTLREWTDAEIDSFRAAGDMLGSTIARQRIQEALLEAKRTLENRVGERTQQLKEQIVEKERAHAELADAQHRLLETSRSAGMAEVATGVLHNVGNVLNSINVSTTLVREELQRSEMTSLFRLASMLEEHSADLANFLLNDPRGSKVPGFIIDLAKILRDEQTLMLREHEQLARNVEHIKEIVAMQQSYARVSGILEPVSVVHLIEDALELNGSNLSRNGVRVLRRFSEVPPVLVDKHKVLQILINLIQNASYALGESKTAERRLVVSVSRESATRVKVEVTDNGIGISPDNLTRIFSHGFTTRRGGHGFGLHSGAIAAKEMNGDLRAHSEGVDCGATFILELPSNEEVHRS